jgi:Dual specificity phosphatase, catalytic domain
MSRSAAYLDLPLPNTFWVVPGRLLAGEYPGGEGVEETRRRLAALRDAGINFFLDLTEANERSAYRAHLSSEIKYFRLPIRDREVPDFIWQMQLIQRRIQNALELGNSIYLHCHAGIGRTGMAVGCYLVEQGLNGKAALKRLNAIWRQSARSKTWPTVPQTIEQAEYILRWSEMRRL